ncbi:MAG: TIGR02646 family protein [Deltaproteobacteria bacterium]|nr:TIGR02646 family protein [Deltaproteobacteria bacterium]
MRTIQKGAPPPAAVRLHAQRATWGEEGPGDKEALRDAAIAEQRGLCAYCNGRLLRDRTTSLEHWRPRSDPNTSHFEWRNLLAVCPGGQQDEWLRADGKLLSPLHCDKSRGNQPLALNPAAPTPDTETLVRYLPDGKVAANDTRYEVELLTTLNLNAAVLVRSRKSVIDAVISKIQRILGLPGHAAQLKAVRALLTPYEAAVGDLRPTPRGVAALTPRGEARRGPRHPP